MQSKNERILLGGGCFWCTQAIFDMLKGVVKTTPGYAGGHTKNPTYEQVCSGDTGHAEVTLVEYDPKSVSLEKILEIFFKMHDPTSLNRQGADFGTQYRSIILYTTESQKEIAKEFIKKEQPEYGQPIVTELVKLDKFYPAEEYHQKYFEKNPYQGYCTFVIKPKVSRIEKDFKRDLN